MRKLRALEEWKEIKNYEGLYWVSNLGRIKSRFRILSTKRKGNNYIYVALSKNSFVKYRRIHRLVAEAFIPNPDNKPEVNHKDRNKKNNHQSNLEWATPKENSKHAMSIKISQFDLNDNLIKSFDSLRDAEKEGFHSSAISGCCKGKKNYNTHKGFKWKYLKQESYEAKQKTRKKND